MNELDLNSVNDFTNNLLHDLSQVILFLCAPDS